MSKFGKMKKLLFTSALSMIFAVALTAQCGNWDAAPNKDEIETAHVLYRDFVKAKDFAKAFPQWEKAYKGAPAADGNRSFHYSDGITLHLDLFAKETDADKKAELTKTILRLYDEWAECFPKEAPELRSTQVYNMFYTMVTPYSQTLEIIDKAIEAGGDATSYTVLDPLSRITVFQFEKEQIDAAAARARHAQIMKIAEYGAANDKNYGEYYEQQKTGAEALFSPIERQIFDCQFFKDKFLHEYKADPDNPDVYRSVYKQLVKGGCDKSDPVIYEIYMKDSLETMRVFKDNNPGYQANEMYKAGDFGGAISKYTEAIASETDASKKAGYYFSIASIQFRKLKKYSDARRSALKAGELRDGWGQPYLMIGDMYSSTSSACGKDGFNRGLAVLAALDKYSYAKSIDSDPEVQAEASKKIGKYSQYKPDQSDAFMMGVKAGEKKKVPCWIGETVSVRFK